MAPSKKSVAQRIAEREQKSLKDIDPENDVLARDDDGSDSAVSDDEIAATEHYLSVGKSKLRQKEAVSLGPEYSGTRVSRDALEDSGDEGNQDSEDDSDGDQDEDVYDEDEEADLAGELDDVDSADLNAEPDEKDEIDSDEALGESDLERFKNFTFRGSSKPQAPKRPRRPVAADFLLDSEDEQSGGGAAQVEGKVSSDSEEEDDLAGSEDTSGAEEDGAPVWDEDDAEESDSGPDAEGDEDGSISSMPDDDSAEETDRSGDSKPQKAKKGKKSGGDDSRAELREMFGQGQKQVVASISEAAKADAEKGAAVRHQRRAFDSILNLRIRLQKAIVATNSLGVAEDTQDAAEEPYKAAEEAAIKLLNTIGSFRESLLSEATAKSGEKRKWDVASDDSSETIWDSMESSEELARSYRRKVLDKWSNKVRQTVTVDKARQLKDSTPQSLVSMLDDQLLSTDRLVKRTRTPRSCAPVQAAKKVDEDPDIYDDADFYQLLLKELVDQRNADASAPGNNVTTVKWAAVKEAKTRKQVDRKASKGRKLRYTVHEKLQNFMAPEDRRTWENEAIDRFFGTLFGQKMELKEDEDEDVEMGGAKIEDDGLRLFRS